MEIDNDPRKLFMVDFNGNLVLAAIDTKDDDKTPIINEHGYAELHFPMAVRLDMGQTQAANANGPQPIRMLTQPVNPLLPNYEMHYRMLAYFGPVTEPNLLSAYKQSVRKARASAAGLVMP